MFTKVSNIIIDAIYKFKTEKNILTKYMSYMLTGD